MNFRYRSRPKGLASALLNKLGARPAVKSRQLVPFIDGLEYRIAPAVAGNLFITGTTLVYNGNFADNNVSVSGTGGSLTINDTAGTITSTVPGFTSGAGPITGTIPSYIQTIAIQGQNGTDVVTVNGTLTTTRSLILSGTTVNIDAVVTADNVTATGTLVTLGTAGQVTTSGAGSVTINGTLDNTSEVSATPYTPTIDTASTIDGNVTFNGLVVGTTNLIVDAGSGGNVTAVQSINLGGTAGFAITGSTDTTVGANTVNLHQIVDGSTGLLVNADGAVNVNGNVVSTGPVIFAANLKDSGPQGFDQVSGSIITTATTGGFSAGGLGSAVDIFVNAYPDPSAAVVGTGTGGASIAGITTGSGGNVFITTGNSYATHGFTSLNGGGSIQSATNNGSLNVSTGTGGLYAASGAGGINLTTSVTSLEVGDFSPAPYGGNVTIANSGQALTLVDTLLPTTHVAVETTNGNVSISNNLALTVSTGASVVAGGSGHSVTLTTTSPNSSNGILTLAGTATIQAASVNLDTTGEVDVTGTGTVTASALNVADTIGSTGGVGETANPLLVTSGSAAPVTVNVTTTPGPGINISSPATGGSPITVAQASEPFGGGISITTVGANNNLVIDGNVSGGTGGPITLQSDQDLSILAGNVSVESGITLTPGNASTSTSGNLTIAAGATLSSNAPITVTASNADAGAAIDNIDISGTIASIGGVTINGGVTATTIVTTLGISGTIASGGGPIDIATASTGATVYNIGGTIAGNNGGVSITATGPAIITLDGTVTSIGPIAISGGAANNATLDLAGTINSTDQVTIGSGTTTGIQVITNSGTVTSAGPVLIDGGTTGTELLTNTGSITGVIVTVTGPTTGAPATLVIGGTVTATGGPITIDNSGNSDASSIILSAVTSGTTPTEIETSMAGDNLVVTPSLTTEIDFSFTGTSVNTLEINTALANIASATSGFTAPITFNNTTVTWVNLATGGTVTVTPTVP